MKGTSFLRNFGISAMLSLLSCAHFTPQLDRTPQGSADYSDWYSHFGACLVSPDNHDYEDAWQAYSSHIKQKIKLNVARYQDAPVMPEIRQFVDSLAAIEPILTAWDSIKKSRWALKMFADKNFVELTSTPAFVYALRDPSFVARNRDPNFVSDYTNTPGFKESFDVVLQSMQDRDIQQALTYFHRMKLTFVDLKGLSSALALVHFFQLPGKIDELDFTPYMKDFPLPSKPLNSSDTFGTAFWNIVEDSITDFLENNPTNVAMLDRISSPDETIPFDDHIVKESHAGEEKVHFIKTLYGKDYQIGIHQLIAIDGMARTLWGEARGCDVTRGLSQYAAIGVVIANRILAVQNSLDQGEAAWQQNRKIQEEDVSLFLNSDSDDNLRGFVQDKTLGQHDFGRKGSRELASTQVVSRPAQFSCWNGYNSHTERLSSIAKLPEGVPDIDYVFKTPKGVNDQRALVNVLCPEIPSNVHMGDGKVGWDMPMPTGSKANWQSAVDIATLLVLDPVRFKQIYQISPEPYSAPLFYTDSGARIPGNPPRAAIDHLTYTNPETGEVSDLPVFKTGGGVCNSLRFFTARSRTVYGVSP